MKSTPVINAARSPYAIRHAPVQTFQIPLWKGHADYRNVEDSSFYQRIE